MPTVLVQLRCFECAAPNVLHPAPPPSAVTDALRRGVEYIKLITTLLDGISKEVALYVLALLDELAAGAARLS